jgi:restriction endonuclease Mrr
MSRQRRVDRIIEILEGKGGRIRLRDLVRALAQAEGNDEIQNSAVWVAIQNENNRLDAQGKAPLFVTSRSGEERGWIRLQETDAEETDASEEAAELGRQVRAENAKLDKKIRERLESMNWRTFEASFLTAVLEKLGFQNVEITQATRDGGVDARVTYQRGLVEAKAIVSAKHWKPKAMVPVTEVRQLRGIKGDEDTALIITTGRFSDDARREASPSQNQRVVYLIDGNRLVEVCKQYEIGVRRHKLPELLILDELEMPSGEDAEEDEGGDGVEEPQGTRVQRIREEYLGDDERGLSVKELAKLTGLAETTVRTYLSSGRRRALFDRIREDPRVRDQVIRILERKRS